MRRYRIFAAFFAFVMGEGFCFYSWEHCLPFLLIYLFVLGLWAYYLYRELKHEDCFSSQMSGFFLSCTFFMLISCVVGFFAVEHALSPMQEAEKVMNKRISYKAYIDPASVVMKKRGLSGVLLPEEYNFKLRFYLPFRKEISKQGKIELLRQLLTHKVAVKGMVKPLVFTANPGCFDGEMYSTLEGIYGRMFISLKNGDYLLLSDKLYSPVRRLSAFSRVLKEKIKDLPLCRNGDMISALLLGGGSCIKEEKKEIMQNCGLAHVLSVSGTHVAVLTGFLLFLFKENSPRKSFFCISLFLVIYSILCGMRAPVCRAVMMLIICMYGKLLYKRRDRTGKEFFNYGGNRVSDAEHTFAGGKIDRLGLLLLTAWLLLLYRPLWLFSLGFRLSFLSVGGLFFLLEKVAMRLEYFLSNEKAAFAAVTLTAQLVTFPLIINAFHRFSLISVICNILLLPLVESAMLAAFCILPFLLAVPQAGELLMLLPDYLLTACLKAGKLLASFPGAVIDMAHWNLFLCCCYYILLLCFLDAGFFRYFSQRLRKIVLASAAGGFLLVCLLPYAYSTPFTVRFMDVGQGDAVLVSSPEGHHIMVDTGGVHGGLDTGKNILLPYLRYLGIKKLDALYISHGDYDHIGGAAGLVSGMPVEKIYLGRGAFTENEKKFLRSLDKGGKAYRVKQGETHIFGDLKVGILAAEDGDNANDNSISMLIVCNGETFLTAGDASVAVEESFCKNIPFADVKLLKAGHHGSDTSTSEYLLEAVSPEAVVISCGRYNSYGHPVSAVLQRLEKHGCKIMRTDRDGAVRVIMSDGRMKMQSYRKERPKTAYSSFYIYPREGK